MSEPVEAAMRQDAVPERSVAAMWIIIPRVTVRDFALEIAYKKFAGDFEANFLAILEIN